MIGRKGGRGGEDDERWRRYEGDKGGIGSEWGDEKDREVEFGLTHSLMWSVKPCTVSLLFSHQ